MKWFIDCPYIMEMSMVVSWLETIAHRPSIEP